MTMADLARLAGVSKITVSRALRDSPAVRPELRERIKTLARRHGYRFNVSARNLRLQKSRLIAVIVDMEVADQRPMSDSYPLALLGGILQELAASDYRVLLAPLSDVTSPEVENAEGIILLGQGAQGEAVRELMSLDLPFLVWGSQRSRVPATVVGSDNRTGGRLAADHLLATGRNRLVFLGDTDHPEVADRLDGFAEAVAATQSKIVAKYACDFTKSGGFERVRSLIRDGVVFDGIFAASDLIAIGTIEALREAGRQAGPQVSIVGYDDSHVASTATPALTTIRQDWHEGGKLLAQKLLALIAGDEARSQALEPVLVVRET